MILYMILGFLAAVAGIAVWGILIYNRFILLGRRKDEAWSGVLVQLKRRHDLVPNLVKTVQGYAAHEKSVLEGVVKARRWQPGAAPGQVAESENIFAKALGKLFALAEAYPELKANQNFIRLQEELVGIEEAIQLARRYFNGTVRDFNVLVSSFPSLIIARQFAFRESAFFELDDPAETAVPDITL